MITKAYIHEYGNGKLEPEHLDIKNVLESRGIAYELFTIKKLHKNQLHFDKNTLVVGDHPTIETVFKRIGFKQEHSSYPISLRKHLKRKIWETTAKSLLNKSYSEGNIPYIFVKPKYRTKLFTGFVINSIYERHKLESISKNTTLFCSSVVEWKSEFRVFVNKSKIVGIKNYKGNPEITPDMSEIEKVILKFEISNEKTNGYSLDFGVLSDGETALVEWNDGYALGSYGLEKKVYTDLIISRWEEILKIAFTNKNYT